MHQHKCSPATILFNIFFFFFSSYVWMTVANGTYQPFFTGIIIHSVHFDQGSSWLDVTDGSRRLSFDLSLTVLFLRVNLAWFKAPTICWVINTAVMNNKKKGSWLITNYIYQVSGNNGLTISFSSSLFEAKSQPNRVGTVSYHWPAQPFYTPWLYLNPLLISD